MSADNDDDNDGIDDDADAYSTVAIGELLDSDSDGAPDNCGEPCIELGMQSDLDDDNDGILDDADAYSLIAIGDLLDTDSDGQPNECDQACSDLGMTADNDDDNDGILDEADAYSLIAIGELLDSDSDGAPDECGESCIELGMQADQDDDNDGVADIIDAFSLNPAASLDTDNDGLPDEWTLGCDASCQLNSGLHLDSYTNDLDNDGVVDANDSDNNTDNGPPQLISVLENIAMGVNSVDGKTASLKIDSGLLVAFDAVDSLLSFEAKLNSQVLVKNDEQQFTLPTGHLEIVWTAIDSAGNRSNSLTQIVDVYPRVSFVAAKSIIGEASSAQLDVELSGESPVYPVIIEWQINSLLSDVDQADLTADFDINEVHQMVIEQGDDLENKNTQGNFTIPVSEDGISENDELLLVNLLAVQAEDEAENYFQIDDTRGQHELTVTYQNLAPNVQLILQQSGLEVANITADGGDVSIRAVIEDGNGNDEHTLDWEISELELAAPVGSVLRFSPENLLEGDYIISLTATDNGINPLSGSTTITIKVVKSELEETIEGLGAIWWLMFLVGGLSIRRHSRLTAN